MITTAIIAFREFLEVFLIIGVFLGVSRKLNLQKEKEIIAAAIVGLILALLLNLGVFLLGNDAHHILTAHNADTVESYLQIFSGLFIVYVIFSLHKRITKTQHEHIKKTKEKMSENVFDISLFLTIIFLIVREGFEIAIFTASISLLSVFTQNFIGLLLGFASAALIGILTFFAYTKISIHKIFKTTEYMIILLGAALFQTGITKFFETHFSIALGDFLSFHFSFLPSEDSFVGSLLSSFFGIDANFSFVRLLIMLCYIGLVYLLFFKKTIVIPQESKETGA